MSAHRCRLPKPSPPSRECEIQFLLKKKTQNVRDLHGNSSNTNKINDLRKSGKRKIRLKLAVSHRIQPKNSAKIDRFP
jgi:hypothetical protein